MQPTDVYCCKMRQITEEMAIVRTSRWTSGVFIGGNEGSSLFPHSNREKAYGKALELGNGEPKTMVLMKSSRESIQQ